MVTDPFVFGVVMLLTVGSIGMAVWMAVAAWQDRGKGTHCEEIRTSISGRCAAMSPAEKK